MLGTEILLRSLSQEAGTPNLKGNRQHLLGFLSKLLKPINNKIVNNGAERKAQIKK